MLYQEGDRWVIHFTHPTATSVDCVAVLEGEVQHAVPMTCVGPGCWEAPVDWPPGMHRYHLLLDHGRRAVDRSAFGVEPDPCGGWHSLAYMPTPQELRDPSWERRLAERMVCDGYTLTAVGWVRHDVLPALYVGGWLDEVPAVSPRSSI